MASFRDLARRLGVVRAADRAAAALGMIGVPADPPGGNEPLGAFLARAAALPAPRVLELGTRRSIPGRSTKHVEWFPHAAEHLGTDLAPGPDVDVVGDVHRLSEVVGRERFDVVVSCSTFEHFKYPHLAAHEVMRTLRIGGLLFVQTHQAFPLHAHPCDYFRFSREALAGLFGTRMGFTVHATAYEFHARVHSRREPGVRRLPAHLNVVLFGEKTGPTPEAYVHELDD